MLSAAIVTPLLLGFVVWKNDWSRTSDVAKVI